MRLFGGVQQIGIGVEDAERAWDWYRRKFGFDIPLIDSTGIAASMLLYTGNEPRKKAGDTGPQPPGRGRPRDMAVPRTKAPASSLRAAPGRPRHLRREAEILRSRRRAR